MIVKVYMKDPDCLYGPIEEAVKEEVNQIKGLSEEEGQELVDTRSDQIRAILTKHFFEYGEYLSVEVDTEKLTATVVKKK